MTPLLVNCTLNDAVVSATPNAQRSLLLFVSVVHLRLRNSLLDDTSYLLVDQINVGTVQRPQIWSNKEMLPAREVVRFRVPGMQGAVNI